MWFPIDFFAHEIAGLFPETVLYYTFKTGIMFVGALASLELYGKLRKVGKRNLIELSFLTGLVSAAFFGGFYYVLYYYVPMTLPQFSPSWLLVTSLLGLHKSPVPLTNWIIDEFSGIHFVSNMFGSFVAGGAFLGRSFKIWW